MIAALLLTRTSASLVGGNTFNSTPLNSAPWVLSPPARSPHTMAPDKPVTGNVLADRMTAPLDKVRDRVAGREVD